MPKMKSNRSAAKRFKITATGKVLKSSAGRRHLLTHKPRDRKKRLGRETEVSPTDKRKVKKLLPYD